MSARNSPFAGPILVGARRAVIMARDIAAKIPNDPHWIIPSSFEPDLAGLVSVAERLVKGAVVLLDVSEQEARMAVRAALSVGRHWTAYQAPVASAAFWFDEVQVAVKHKSYDVPFHVIQGGARFPRVSCPELSVSGPANDVRRSRGNRHNTAVSP